MEGRHSIDENTVLDKLYKVSHELDDGRQLAVFDAEKSELMVFNELAVAIWSLLDGQITLGEIAEELASHVAEAPSLPEVTGQVILFAQDLLERGAVSLVRK